LNIYSLSIQQKLDDSEEKTPHTKGCKSSHPSLIMEPTVLITGGSQGIGKATAFLFAKHGYRVALAARSDDRLQSVVHELQLEHSAIAIPTDVRDPVQVKTLIDKTLDAYGSIDVLVNNAGIYISGPAEEFSLDDWHQAIDTNLWGYIHTIQALLPHFVAQSSGTIVNVCSVGGKLPLPYLAPYSTSKYAVTGLTEALHTELAPKGIHVAGIYPNIIRSDFLERAIFRGKDEADQRARRQQVETVIKVPLVETPEHVASAIWEAVQHKRTEVVVGSGNLALGAHGVFPKAMQWIFRKTFQNKDAS
jgi:short-subunit dehydrogenase